MARAGTLWLVWLLATLAGTIVLAGGMFYGGASRASLVIGRTTDGHHQIELACTACHTTPFAGRDAIQRACVGCHGKDLAEAKDSHPAKKFTDPRNADRLQKLEATQCVTCHTEHRPRVTQAMGVTLPGDFCALCHQDIAKDRPSHKDLAFSTCTQSGCHNYHDNRALYEDFLEKHASDPDLVANAIVKLKASPPDQPVDAKPLASVSSIDAPPRHAAHTALNDDWLATAHARSGVNCSGCHAPKSKSANPEGVDWLEKPGLAVCATCHQGEAKTFTEGRHGMRLAAGIAAPSATLFGRATAKPLSPMRPAIARLPMKAAAHATDLTCTTCHSAHRFETRNAEVEVCLSCHDDNHSRAYPGSPHHKLTLAERGGTAPKGSGVTCATCHMPRETREDPDTGEDRLLVVHNQNANLRPSEKMIRSVCMNCHGLGFAIDALADPNLVARNFTGRPAKRVESIDWVRMRLKEREAGTPGDASGK